MKKTIALTMAAVMLLALTACSGGNAGSDTVAGKLSGAFEEYVKANPSATAQETADELLANEVIAFSGASMPVEPGFLMGFGEAEITGFKEGVMFAPMIGTIPFVGYVFVLEDGADAGAFVKLLADNADPRWNICTEAEETVAESVGSHVFFVMSPLQFEEE